MKKRTLGIGLLLTGFALTFGAFLVPSSKAKIGQTEAIGSYSTNASTYYNGITATTGKQLAAQLHDLITSTHRYYTSYDDNGKNLYQQKTDQYYENGSKVNGYLYEFYSGVKWPNAWAATAGSTSGGYNREHCWCQSNSVNTGGKQMWGTTGGGSDMHHIRPVECRLNSTRNNHPYGEVSNRDSKKSYAKLGSNETYALGGYTDTTADVFEPLDSKKGDVARIILYTYLHYNSYTISDLFGSYGTTNGSGDSGYFSTSLLSLTKTTNQTTESKALTMLLEWNSNDPVDEIEQRRNEQVAVYQGNRNPFIDNSSYADAIWGTTGITSISKTSAELTTGETTTISAISSNSGTISWTTSNSSICSVSSATSSSGSSITLTAGSTTGTATITASVTISGTKYSKTCTATVSSPKTLSSISVSEQKTSYEVGDSFVRPTVTANYSDSSHKDVSTSATFSGYDLSVAGNYTVTVSYTEGTTKTTTYGIVVTQSTGVKYYQKCTSMSDIENGGKYVFIGYKSSTSTYYAMPSYSSGNNIYGVAVTLTENNTRLTEANKSTASVYTLTSTGNTNEYYIGDGSLYLYAAGTGTNNHLKGKASTDSSAGAFTISYSSSFSLVAASSNRNTMRFNASATNPLFSCYADNTSQTEVMLFKETSSGSDPEEVTLSSIELDTTNVQKSFHVGDSFNYDGLIVTAHYSDESSEELDSFDVSTPDLSSTGQKTVTVSYEDKEATYTITVNPAVTLSSISLNTDDVKKSFGVGEEFNYDNLVVTAHFSDSSEEDVTIYAEVTTPDMTTTGEKNVTVSYTYKSTTRTATYSITVSEGGGSETGSYTWDLSIASYNTPTSAALVTWTSDCCVLTSEQASGKTAANNYLGGDSNARTSSRFYSGNTMRFTPAANYEITSVVYTATSSTYATALSSSNWTNATAAVSNSTVVTITPTDAISEFYAVLTGTTGSTSIVVNYSYTPEASLSSISLDTSNVQTTFSVGDTFNYNGLVVTAHYSDSSSSVVTPTSVLTPSTTTTGNKTVTVTYTENEVTKTETYTITVTANPTISWTAPTINVYSGSTLSGTDVNAWAVTYNDGAGHQTVLTYSQLTVKLGGTTISIPHTWAAEDDGKTLTATYNSLTTTTSSSVQITQSVNTINKEVPGTIQTSSLVFTEACGGSGTADDSKTWTITSDANESTFDKTKGIHYGTGSAAVEYIQLVSDSFTSGTITQVVVNASGASGVSGSVSVTVGGNEFGEVQSFDTTASNKTFTGSASAGRIVVRIYKASAAVKAIYCKSVAVSFSTSNSIVNIANSLDHIAAQRVAVKFAKAFNAAMDTTSGCTTNLSSAWSTCSSAYSTFLTEAAALGSAEEAYAKDLIKYATAQYSDDSGEACIERMLKTYEICVQKHGQTAFMNELVELGKAPTSITTLTLNNATNITIIVVASVIMIAAVGGYFYIRRLKQK